MFGKLFKGKDNASVQEHDSANNSETLKKNSWGSGLQRTNQGLGQKLRTLLSGKKGLDEELRDELEMVLIGADVGVETTAYLLDTLGEAMRQSDKDMPAAEVLAELLVQLLVPVAVPMQISADDKPYVIMVVGVNGVGKTTSIGKIAHRLKADGQSVILAAGDTFRAAAIDQLQVWGERNDIPVISQQPGSDSASVIYDALQSAKNRDADVLIADTAGRLHNKAHLMAELEKVVRVMQKLDEDAPQEILLVLDASTGQNALNQAREFSKVAPLTGLVITKLDGTARGGIVLALAHQMALPVRFIGLGEGIEDLQPFDATSFVEGLLVENQEAATRS